jgi:RNA polymerase sigma-70 factor (ECF subfamily)
LPGVPQLPVIALGTTVALWTGMLFNEFTDELLPHTSTLMRLARRLSPHEAEDLVQETFVRAIAARHRYRAGSNARAWLCRILCNLAVSAKRKQARDRRLQQRVAEIEPTMITTEPRADRNKLRQAIDSLSDEERRVIELADVDGLRYREIANVLGCPIGTVMSRLHRARRHLSQAALHPSSPPASRRAAAAPPAQTEIHCAAA